MNKKNYLNTLKNSRKGFESFNLVLIVVVGLSVMIILIFLMKGLNDKQEESAYNSRCRSSVLIHSKLVSNNLGDSFSDESDIDCPAQFLSIKKQRKDLMNREVANLMYNCWRNYGEGKLQLFKGDDVKFCAVCSVFEFEDKSTKLDGFTRFLMSERIPDELVDGYRPSYLEFLTSRQQGKDAFDSNAEVDNNYFAGDKRYVVLFGYNKVSFWYKAWNTVKGVAVGATVGVVGGAIIFITAGTSTPFVVFAVTTVLASSGAGAAVGSGLSTATDWHASVVIVEYDSESIDAFGCENLPVSLLDKKFR